MTTTYLAPEATTLDPLSAPPAPEATSMPDLTKSLLIGGAIAVLMGIFLPLVSYVGITFSMFGMNSITPIAALLMLGGVAAIAASIYGIVQAKKPWVPLATGIVALSSGVWTFLHIANLVSDIKADGDVLGLADSVHVGIGAWLLLAGGIALIVAWYRTRSDA